MRLRSRPSVIPGIGIDFRGSRVTSNISSSDNMTLHVGVIISVANSPNQLESILPEKRILVMESIWNLLAFQEGNFLPVSRPSDISVVHLKVSEPRDRKVELSSVEIPSRIEIIFSSCGKDNTWEFGIPIKIGMNAAFQKVLIATFCCHCHHPMSTYRGIRLIIRWNRDLDQRKHWLMGPNQELGKCY